jgi:DNA-binding GntR family transcriptional regulator
MSAQTSNLWRIDPVASIDTSVRRQTIDALRQYILNFQLKPGQRLVEREFIERLGVSRTTFREAIRELAAEGLLTVVAQKGARVSAPSLEEAADLYEVRSALESIVVTRFVERATDAEIRSLRTAVKNFKRVANRTTDILELLRAKEIFYDVLVRGARSNALQQLLDGIKARVHALRATSLSHPGRVSQTVAELGAIVEAITLRDAEKASRLCAEHVRNACKTALASLREAEEAPNHGRAVPVRR